MTDVQTPAASTGGSSGSTQQVDQTSTGGPSGVQGSQNTAPPAAAASSAGATDWTASLPDTQKLWVQNKGFKAASEALESYQQYEKLMGVPKERLLKLPDKPDAPEWNEIYDRMGRPKEAAEYKFAPPKGGQLNPEFTSWAQKQFHELGLSRKQGEALATRWNEYAMGDVEKANQTSAANLKAEQTALQREWGSAHESKLKSAFKAAETFGLGREEVTQLEKALGFSKTLKFLDSLGSKLGEDSFVTGEGGGGFKGALTPEMAQAEIAELKKDSDFIRRYNSGDREAFKKMQDLHKFAYPDLPQD